MSTPVLRRLESRNLSGRGVGEVASRYMSLKARRTKREQKSRDITTPTAFRKRGGVMTAWKRLQHLPHERSAGTGHASGVRRTGG